jgi:hypothetical protein
MGNTPVLICHTVTKGELLDTQHETEKKQMSDKVIIQEHVT